MLQKSPKLFIQSLNISLGSQGQTGRAVAL